MDRELAGQPLWLWAVGAGVVVLGYLYFRSHSSTTPASSSGQPAGGAGKSTETSSFKETITNLQGPPSPQHKKKKAKG
jgi:hypothetical protein